MIKPTRSYLGLIHKSWYTALMHLSGYFNQIRKMCIDKALSYVTLLLPSGRIFYRKSEHKKLEKLQDRALRFAFNDHDSNYQTLSVPSLDLSRVGYVSLLLKFIKLFMVWAYFYLKYFPKKWCHYPTYITQQMSQNYWCRYWILQIYILRDQNMKGLAYKIKNCTKLDSLQRADKDWKTTCFRPGMLVYLNEKHSSWGIWICHHYIDWGMYRYTGIWYWQG